MTAGSWFRRCFAASLALLVSLLQFPTIGAANDLAFRPRDLPPRDRCAYRLQLLVRRHEPSQGFIFKVYNGGLEDTTYELVSSSTVTLNGTEILGPNDFNQNVAYLEVPVALQAQNTLSVEVRGKPGGAMIIKLFPSWSSTLPRKGRF